MSFGTTIYCGIYLSRKCFENKEQIEDEIETARKMQTTAKKQLYALACMTEPQKFCNEEQRPQDYIDSEFATWIEEFAELTNELYDLELLLDNWDKATVIKREDDGATVTYARRWPEGLEYGSAFVCGDYLLEEKNEDKKE